MVARVNSDWISAPTWPQTMPLAPLPADHDWLAQSTPKWSPQQTRTVEQILQQMIDGTISPQQADDAIRAATGATASRAGWISKLLPFLKWGGLAIGVAADLLLNAEPAGGNAEVRWEINNRFVRMSQDPSQVGSLLSELVTRHPNEDVQRGLDTLYGEFFGAMTAAKGGNREGLERAQNILSAIYQLHLGAPDAAAQQMLAQIVRDYARYAGVPAEVLSDPPVSTQRPAFDPNLVGPATVGPRVAQFTADELNARLQRFASTFNGATPASEFIWRQVSDSGRFEVLPLESTDTLRRAQAAAAASNRDSQRVSIPVPVDYWDQASGQHVQGVLTFSGLDPRVVLAQFNDYLVALDRSESFNVRGNLETILQGAGLSVEGLRTRARAMDDADFAAGLPRVGGRQASFGDSSRYEASKQTIRNFNAAQTGQGRIDDISLFVPTDQGRFFFMERITRGQAASLLQWAIDGGTLRDGTSAQAVIDANGLGGVLGIGSDGRVVAREPVPPQARDDPFTEKVLPQLTPEEQEAWRRFAEANPDVVTLVREAAHDATDADRAEAARALMAGAYGQDVVAWLRAGGLGSGRLPPGVPPRGTVVGSGEPDQPARARLDSLVARSTMRSPFDELPGDRGGPVNDRYLSTRTLTEADLGYRSGITDPPTAQPLPERLDDIQRVDVTETNVQLVSDVHNGRLGSVRLAQLASGPLAGRVVAIKTYPADASAPGSPPPQILQEARSAQLLHNLGLLRFHGVFQDSAGQWNIVTDVVAGDFPAARFNTTDNPISARTFAQLETALARLDAAGLRNIGDFQYLVTPEGQVGVIDAGDLERQVGRNTSTDPNSPRGQFTAQRALLLAAALSAVGNAYLDQLARLNPQAYESLMAYINGGVRATDPALRPMMESLAGRYGSHRPGGER
jgi:hypothetical protein